jgi:signal recognition particle GTPase
MAFEGLSERLQNTIAKIKGKGKVTEQDVKTMMREVRFALIEADVNLKVVKKFVKSVSERAVGVDVMQSLTPGQQVIKNRSRRTNIANGWRTITCEIFKSSADSYYDGRFTRCW